MHLAILLALSVLAGCAAPHVTPVPPSPSADAAPRVAHADPAPASASFEAPRWAPGDWWRWHVSVQESAPFDVTTLVVSRDAGSYVLGFLPAEREAAFHAFADHAVPLGPVDAASFAWEVHDKPAQVLRFPLAAGDAWNGTEQGRAMTFHANATRATGPSGVEMDAIEATGVGRHGPVVAFVYAAETGNFLRYAVHYGEAEPYSVATLIAYGHGAREGVAFESDDLFATFSGLPATPPAPATFDVPANVTDVLLACWIGGPDAQRATLLAPSGDAMGCAHAGLVEGANTSFAMDARAAEPGAWTALAATGAGYVEVEVFGLRLAPVAIRAGS